jgi:Sortase domain
MGAAAGIAREVARASVTSAPAGRRSTPDVERPPARPGRAPVAPARPDPVAAAAREPARPGSVGAVREPVRPGRVRAAREAAKPGPGGAVREPVRPGPVGAVREAARPALANAVREPAKPSPAGAARRPAPPAGRRGAVTRAARRAGGPHWGVRFMFSLVAALMVLTVTGFAFERLTGVDVLPDGPAARFWPAPRDFPVLNRSVPVSIRARSVRIDAGVHRVGNAPGGAVAVPTGDRVDEAGWYDKGPTPGEYGPAVIVGHVDSGTGPSVFHKLSRLRPGNRVEITRADGTVAVFEVNTVKRFDRDNLPAGEVFGDFSRPSLRLITCGGRWVGGTTGYADNIVVFASLVKAR